MDGESLLGGFAPDDDSGSDVLGVSAEAHVLADMLVSRSTLPPVSIGILGRPGSGKSFTARLVARRVDELLRATGPLPPEDRAYVYPVAQIEIDAWHSAGGSPWLVLAERIYSALDDSVDATASENWSRALLELPSVTRLHARATSELNAAQAALAEARSEREDVATAYFAASEHRARVESTSIWPDVRARLAERLSAEERADLDQSGARLGLTSLSNRPDVLAGIHDAMRTVGGTASLLTDTRTVRRYLGPVLLAVLALTLGALAVAFGYVVLTNVNKLKDQVATFFSAVAGVSSLIAAFGVLLAGLRQNQADRALQTLRAHESVVSAAVADVESEHRHKLLQATAEDERLRSVFAETEARGSAARRAVSIAASRQHDLESRGTLRAVATAYKAPDQPAETLPLVIRSDLAALSSLLHLSPADGLPERLVIYVDGLDQCGPRTTVDFLLAIQQLLAFPVFAVVVIADPHHLAGALAAMGVLTPPGSRDGELSREAAEYLAKLFRLHIRPAPAESGEVPALAYRIGATLSPADLHLVERIAPVAASPRDAKRLVDTLRFAKSLYSPDGELPLALQAHVAVLALAPAGAGRFADVAASGEADTFGELSAALSRAGVYSETIERILETYASLTPSSAEAIEELARWAPIARRLAL